MYRVHPGMCKPAYVHQPLCPASHPCIHAQQPLPTPSAQVPHGRSPTHTHPLARVTRRSRRALSARRSRNALQEMHSEATMPIQSRERRESPPSPRTLRLDRLMDRLGGSYRWSFGARGAFYQHSLWDKRQRARLPPCKGSQLRHRGGAAPGADAPTVMGGHLRGLRRA